MRKIINKKNSEVYNFFQVNFLNYVDLTIHGIKTIL